MKPKRLPTPDEIDWNAFTDYDDFECFSDREEDNSSSWDILLICLGVLAIVVIGYQVLARLGL